MTTNLQEGPQTKRADQPVGIEPTPTPVANLTGVSGVAVYDQSPNRELDPAMRPSASVLDDNAPVGAQSNGNMIAWIIGVVVLIIIVYFVLQMLF